MIVDFFIYYDLAVNSVQQLWLKEKFFSKMANKQTLIKLTENKLKHNPPTHNHHHLKQTYKTSI